MSEPITFDVIRCYDAEVAKYKTGEESGDYAMHRDLAKLALPPEAKPVKFACRVLSRKQRRLVQDQPTLGRRYELAFALGVMSIENLPDANGTPRTLTLTRERPDAALSDDTLDATGLGDHDLQEIGSVIYERSFLALGTPLSCPLLDSSARAWGAQVSRLAEQRTGSSTQTGESRG